MCDPQKLKTVRIKLRLSVYELSEMSGVSPGTIYRYERGGNQAQMGAICKIADALGCDLKDLLTDDILKGA